MIYLYLYLLGLLIALVIMYLGNFVLYKLKHPRKFYYEADLGGAAIIGLISWVGVLITIVWLFQIITSSNQFHNSVKWLNKKFTFKDK